MRGSAALRAVVGRVVLLAFGLVVGVLALEGLLQLGAIYVRATRGRPSIGAPTGGRRIVALGDSNTYGLFLARDQAYPQQLGHLWNESHRNQPVEVLNMGYPGNSSSQVVGHLPEILATARPAIITVMIGVNDFWTVPLPVDDRTMALGNVLWRRSRVYRAAYMLARMGHASDVEVVVEPAQADGSARRTVRYGAMEISAVRLPARQGEAKGWSSSLARNLRTITMLARAADVEPVLLTYPSSDATYGATDAIIRNAAIETGTPLVDVAAHFKALCPSGDCPALLFKDQHPTAEGAAIAAKVVADWLASHPREISANR
jgi:lysophospholipase L1-like esterase